MTLPKSLPALLLIVAAFVLLMVMLGVCVQEDAFISVRYAQNLVDGNGLVYNAGERVEGYTNFLWTVMLAGGLKLGVAPVPLARGMSMTAALLLLAVVFLAARWGDRTRNATGGLLAVALVAATPGLAAEGVQGLETLFFSLLITAGVALGIEARQRELDDHAGSGRLFTFSTVLLVLSALTRPEGVGILVLLTGGSWLVNLRHQRRFVSRNELWASILFVLLYAPYWIWRFTYYGYPLPNTYYAKVGSSKYQLLDGLVYIGQFLLHHPVVSLLSLWAVVGLWSARKQRANVLGLTGMTIIAGYLCYVVMVGGDFKITSRFIIPILPLWALLLDGFVSKRLSFALPQRLRQAWVWSGVIILVFALNAAPTVNTMVDWAERRAWDLKARTACGKWLKQNADPTTVLAIHSAGIIPYYSGLYTIDMWGLSDLHIAHKSTPDMGKTGQVGHQKSDTAYVLARRPTYFVDEQFYLTDRQLERALGPVVQPTAEFPRPARYMQHSVPLSLEGAADGKRYWFNFLLLEQEPPGR
jgi:arabinofuranosyltransferase